jgi:hypothetical protein
VRLRHRRVRRQRFAALAGERVVARPEQEPHLLGGDHVASVQALDADHPGTDHTPGVYSYGKSWLVTGQPFTAPPTTLATR